MLTNNKWWVWKTTLSYNIAKMFAKNWYKTILIDLDPQCNLSRLALWEDFFDNEEEKNDIISVLGWLIEWTSDIRKNTNFTKISENLSILPWNIKLSNFDRMLSNSFNEASSGQLRWYVITSAIDRFLREKWLDEEIDIFIIDTNPSLSQLNKAIFLWTDYFLVPTNPDTFNHQWVENIWDFFYEERRNWNLTSKVLARANNITSGNILNGEPIFIWYVINSYNVYSKKPISSQDKRIKRLPEQIKKHLSLKQSKNGLVELSHKKPIWYVQDYGQLSTLSQDKLKAIFEITKEEAGHIWTIENLEKSKDEFDEIFREVLWRVDRD